MTEAQIVSSIATLLVGGASTWFALYLGKPKRDQEIKGIINSRWDALTERLQSQLGIQDKQLSEQSKQIEEYKQQLIHTKESNKTERVRVEGELKKLKRANEKCEYQHLVTRLQLQQVETRPAESMMQQVFCLDDDEDIVEEFERAFEDVSVVSFKGFTDSDKFVTDTVNSHPAIVILDYQLDRGKTAEDLIDRLGYEPEIIIMSYNRNYGKRFNRGNVRFFEKEEHFIYKIQMAVIKFLIEKNKN